MPPPPPLCSLRWATEERDRAKAGATDGADEVDTIIKGGKQRGKQSQEFRLSIPAPFRLEARIFRLRFSRNKIRHRDDFGTGERVPRRIKQRRRMDGWANCRSLSPPVGNSQNRGQSAAPSPSAAPMTLSKSV